MKFDATATIGIDMDEADFCSFSGATIDMTTKGTNTGIKISGGARNTAHDFRVANASVGWEVAENSDTNSAYGNTIYNWNVGTCDYGFKFNGYDDTHRVNGNRTWGGYVINYSTAAAYFNDARGNDVTGIIIGGTASPAAATRPLYLTDSYGNIINISYVENDATAEYVVSLMGGSTDNIINIGM